MQNGHYKDEFVKSGATQISYRALRDGEVLMSEQKAGILAQKFRLMSHKSCAAHVGKASFSNAVVILVAAHARAARLT
jgi:hypothetical protein